VFQKAPSERNAPSWYWPFALSSLGNNVVCWSIMDAVTTFHPIAVLHRDMMAVFRQVCLEIRHVIDKIMMGACYNKLNDTAIQFNFSPIKLCMSR
jgi:hypothetical protein